MRIVPSIIGLCALAAVSISGCAGIDRDRADTLIKDVDGLKASLEETRSRVERLDNKLSLLQDKVERYEAAKREATAAPAASAEAATPPEGLKVVDLGADAAKPVDASASRAASNAPQVAGGGAKAVEAETPDALYKKGHELLSGGNLAGARMVFLKIADKYPEYSLVDNALYWAAETYYSERDFTRAIAGFKEVERKYPNRNKAPDAVLKIGLAYIEMNEVDRGREYLARVIKEYPGSEAADTARKTVEGLRGKKAQ